jgi:hypothetical protein
MIICPVCRSTLEPQGYVDFGAPRISIVPCPVCNAPIWIPSGWPLPKRWTSFKVIKRNQPVIYWQNLKQEKPGVAKEVETLSEEQKKPIYEFSDLSQGIKKASTWVIIILALVLAIKIVR